MKRFLRIILISTLCSSTYQASIGVRPGQNPRLLSEFLHSPIALEQNLHPSAVFDKVDVVLEKIDAVANFIRDYNAIPKIGSALKFIMPRFKVGRKFLMYYDHVKAKNEGRFPIPSLQKTSKSNKAVATTPTQTQLEYVYIYPSRAALGISKALSVMKLAPEEARVPQAFKRVTCYNCRTRKEQWKRYNHFQNRRKRWPKQFYNPKHIIPASNELHLFDYVTVTVKPTTAITIKSFRDILPGPNQLPYYANMFLDVFDTHFETWNSKIRSVIHTIKQKWRQNQDKNKDRDSRSQSSSSSYSSSCSSETKSDSSSDYVSTSNESSRSNSNYSSSSEYYDETDDSSRMHIDSDDRKNKRIYVRNATNKATNKEEEYEYYSDSSDEQESSSKERVVNNKGRNNKNYYESASYNQNIRENVKKISKVNPPGNNDQTNLNARRNYEGRVRG